MTAEQKAKLKKLFRTMEIVAGDLQEIFKAEAVKLITENPCDFAASLQDGKALDDSFLKELATVQNDAWILFSHLDALVARDVTEQPALNDGQTFEVTYHVAYKTELHVPLGESLVDGLLAMKLPEIPPLQKEVGFKVEKVELDGLEIPNPLKRQ